MKKKIMAIAAVIAALSICVTGSLAYLRDVSNTVTNTFVVEGAEIKLSIEETGATAVDNNSSDLNRTYQGGFLPGATLPKDPKVVLGADSEPCWIFAKIEESNNDRQSPNAGKVVTYEVDDGWKELADNPGVYYKKVETSPAAAAAEYPVLKDNQVVVNSAIEQAEWNDLANAAAADQPKLIFTAYAIQLSAADTAETDDENAATAWNLVNAS